MLITPDPNVESALIILQDVRANLDRIESLLRPGSSVDADDVDPKNPLNKNGVNLTARGIEVAYRLFDAGRTRYRVAEALGISYGAATHRWHSWKALGEKNRDKQPLD
jgi:hypothetical protein